MFIYFIDVDFIHLFISFIYFIHLILPYYILFMYFWM